MRSSATIRWKALFMLLVFATSWMTICHCAPVKATERTCCERAETPTPPCKDPNGCSGKAAVHLQLTEKQAEGKIVVDPAPPVVLVGLMTLVNHRTTAPIPVPELRSVIFSPPDRQSLLQRYLI